MLSKVRRACARGCFPADMSTAASRTQTRASEQAVHCFLCWVRSTRAARVVNRLIGRRHAGSAKACFSAWKACARSKGALKRLLKKVRRGGAGAGFTVWRNAVLARDATRSLFARASLRVAASCLGAWRLLARAGHILQFSAVRRLQILWAAWARVASSRTAVRNKGIYLVLRVIARCTMRAYRAWRSRAAVWRGATGTAVRMCRARHRFALASVLRAWERAGTYAYLFFFPCISELVIKETLLFVGQHEHS